MSVVRSVCLRLLTYYKKCKYYDEFAVFFLLKKKKNCRNLIEIRDVSACSIFTGFCNNILAKFFEISK